VDYEIKDTGSVRTLTLRGRLTFQGNERFREIVDGLNGQPHRALGVDVSQLDFIDSAGLGLLLLLNEAAGGMVTLHRPQGQVKRLLAASRFNTLMAIADWE
jgi:stage II sporulation protein AA (anti-sigma F factor antagonist)